MIPRWTFKNIQVYEAVLPRKKNSKAELIGSKRRKIDPGQKIFVEMKELFPFDVS